MAKVGDTPNENRVNAPEEAASSRRASAEKPVYEKPRLRRYDQIDQVKPYGPSEL